jgi:hypothetical protein
MGNKKTYLRRFALLACLAAACGSPVETISTPPPPALTGEPIAAGSLTRENFDLRSGSTQGAGQLRFADSVHTIVELIPAESLALAANYELVLHPASAILREHHSSLL